MAYPCPFKGTKRGVKTCYGIDGKDFPTIRGWKGHMSRHHTSWSEEQLSAVVGATGPDAAAGKATFLAEIDTPVSIAQNESLTNKTTGEPTKETGPSQPAKEPIKRVPLKSERMMKFINALPEKIFKQKGIELDKEDKEFMDSATEMLEGIFGVAFEIPESMWVIKSRWMALLFPVGAIALVYLKHTFSFDMFKKKDEETPEGGSIEDAIKKAREQAN